MIGYLFWITAMSRKTCLRCPPARTACPKRAPRTNRSFRTAAHSTSGQWLAGGSRPDLTRSSSAEQERPGKGGVGKSATATWGSELLAVRWSRNEWICNLETGFFVVVNSKRISTDWEVEKGCWDEVSHLLLKHCYFFKKSYFKYFFLVSNENMLR